MFPNVSFMLTVLAAKNFRPKRASCRARCHRRSYPHAPARAINETAQKAHHW